MDERRSAIPKVMGILMITFAGLGLAHTIAGLFRNSVESDVLGKAGFTGIILIFTLLDLGIGLLHLVAGLSALSYKDRAPRLATLYSWLKIVEIVALFVIYYIVMRPIFGGGIHRNEAGVIGISFMFAAVVMLAWPVIVLALMSRPRTKLACSKI